MYFFFWENNSECLDPPVPEKKTSRLEEHGEFFPLVKMLSSTPTRVILRKRAGRSTIERWMVVLMPQTLRYLTPATRFERRTPSTTRESSFQRSQAHRARSDEYLE